MKHSCWSFSPPIIMAFSCNMTQSWSPTKMLLSTSLVLRPKLLSCLVSSSCGGQAVNLVVFSCHRFIKLKVSKILKLRSWKACSGKLLGSSGVRRASSTSSKNLSLPTASCCPFCFCFLKLCCWEAAWAEGFFLVPILQAVFLQAGFLATCFGKAVPSAVLFLSCCCCSKLSKEKLSCSPFIWHSFFRSYLGHQVLVFRQKATIQQVAYHAVSQPKLDRTSNKIDLLSSLFKLDFLTGCVDKMVSKVA